MGDEWPIAEMFDDDYLHFYLPHLPDALNEGQTDVIWSMLGLTGGDAVLDLACGHGRIANRLAARGAIVAGYDATAMFLDLARKDAAARGVAVEYVLGDMRELPWVDRFDAVLSWFTAFGYFDDDQNRQVLARVFDSLRAGGRFLVEVNHRDGLLARWAPSSVRRVGEDMMIDEREFDPITGRSNTRRVIIRDGRVREQRFFTRLFGYTELRDWLLAAGFCSVRGFGWNGDPLTPSSLQMIVVAEK